MSSKKLEIFRLSKEGTVSRNIVCLGGRVSVFRANREDLLEEFRVALQGRVPSSQFRILLDDGPFVSADHFIIGFNERFDSKETTTVSELLVAAGASPANLPALLSEFGLTGLKSIAVSELSDSQQRILRLIAATAAETGKVIILNDPFEGLAEEICESAANRIAEFAYQHSAIVIVSRLSVRPESWIDNPYISRVQLERPRRGTIGAGSVLEMEFPFANKSPRAVEAGDRPQSAATIGEAAETSAPQSLTSVPSSDRHPASAPIPAAPSRSLQALQAEGIKHPLTIALAAGYLCVLCVLVWLVKNDKKTNVVVVQRPPDRVQVAQPEPVVPKAGFQGLPEGIQSQVLLAFRDPDALLRSIPMNLQRKRPAQAEPPRWSPSPVQIPIVEPPAPSAPTEFMGPGSVPGYEEPGRQLSAEEIEQRREEIRQRLLQAIMQRRQQMAEQAGQ